MSTTETRNRLIYYQGFLAIGCIFFFFTHLDIYLVEAELVSSPIGWLSPYFALIITWFILGKLKLKCPSRSILFWCLGYLIISLISYSYVLQSLSSFLVLIDRSFSAVFLLLISFVFNNQRVQCWARYAILIATFTGIIINFYQLLNPSAFLSLVDGNRAAGLYINPNNCGIAFLLGMIFSVTMLTQKFRIPWVLMVGFGMLTTQSRAAILCWFLAVILMILNQIIIPKIPKRFILWILGIGLLLFLSFQLGSEWTVESSNNLLDSNVLVRLTGIMDRSTLEDESAIDRQEVARKGWEMFLDRPIFGYGIGATFDPNTTGFHISTHNMYVLHLAEYGACGILILPLAVYAVIHRARGEAQKLSIVFASSIFLWSFFSHTVLDDRDILISFALMVVMSANSQTLPNRIGGLTERGVKVLSSSVMHR